MPSITSANATYFISVASIFPTPTKLQGFAADDIFDTDPLESAELQMGVDGVLSAGFVFVPVRQRIALKADSPSNTIFDTWYAQQQAVRELFTATGIISLPSIGLKFTLTTGFLTTYPSINDARRVLEPRRFGITWQTVSPALI